jgi:selenocysteine lyase/cysteine desulfurase
LSFKHLFSRSLAAAPRRLHFAAHSHHLWPDATFEAQKQCWLDAAELADRKWDKVMGEVWPQAQANVADELGALPDSIVFSSNTHDFLVRLVAAVPARGAIRILTSDGEFHSARRQFARWEEEGQISVTRIAAEPFDSFSDRFTQAAQAGGHDLIFVSRVLFGSGRLFDRVDDIAGLARPEGSWAVIDGYHAFMAIPEPFSKEASKKAFFLGGGYKYAMAGEGVAFMHCPPAFGPRPPITGWYAEFGDLTAPPGSLVGYTLDAMRFMGATFDPSALYRFNAVHDMLRAEGLSTGAISAHTELLQRRLLDATAGTVLAEAELLNPLDEGQHARFLAFRTPKAGEWKAALLDRNCVTDHRGDVLRIGFGLYQDEADVDALVKLIGLLD